MAISVKNISPKKLTSLLDWFSRNADEIYQNGTPGAKNVLDNALVKEVYSLAPYGVAENLPNPNGILTKAYHNIGDVFRSNPYPAFEYIDENIDENTLQNLILSYHGATKAAKTQTLNTPTKTFALGDVYGSYNPYNNPVELGYGPARGTFTMPLTHGLDMNNINLVHEVTDDLYQLGKVRPHANTALGKWYFNKGGIY